MPFPDAWPFRYNARRRPWLAPPEETMAIDKEFLEILACPVCRGSFELVEHDGKEELVCAKCHRAFPVEDGIPNLLPDAGVVRR